MSVSSYWTQSFQGSVVDTLWNESSEIVENSEMMNVIEKHEFLDSLNSSLSHMTGTKKPQHVRFFSLDQVGALREIRTPDPLVRSQVLYPAEL